MTSDNHEGAVERLQTKLPDDWLEGVGLVGLMLTIFSSAYLRGRYDESGLPPEQFADHAVDIGLLWPIPVGFAGMVLMGAATMTFLVGGVGDAC